jgi:hypothetical protein
LAGNGDGSQDSIAALGHEQPRADATARSSLKTSSNISIATSAVVPDCRFSAALADRVRPVRDEPDKIAGASSSASARLANPDDARTC